MFVDSSFFFCPVFVFLILSFVPAAMEASLCPRGGGRQGTKKNKIGLDKLSDDQIAFFDGCRYTIGLARPHSQ